MSLSINLPHSIEKQLRDRAVAEGLGVEQLATAILSLAFDPSKNSKIPSDFIDREYHANCDSSQISAPSIEDVRAMIAAKIGGSLKDDINNERNERL